MKGIKLEKYFDQSNQGIGRKKNNSVQILNAILVGNMVDAYQNRNDFYTFKTFYKI